MSNLDVSQSTDDDTSKDHKSCHSVHARLLDSRGKGYRDLQTTRPSGESWFWRESQSRKETRAGDGRVGRDRQR
jgi:hypothetical protein